MRIISLLAVCALAGCQSVPTRNVERLRAPPEGQVLVSFVRTSMLTMDSQTVHIWDGDHYIGPLNAGRVLQYVTTPGEHLFIGRIENWTYAAGSLEAGRHYHIKANITPMIGSPRVHFGVALATDERIAGWDKFPTVAPDEAARAAFDQSRKPLIGRAMQLLKDGTDQADAAFGLAHAR
jgi:hypothetical protein